MLQMLFGFYPRETFPTADDGKIYIKNKDIRNVSEFQFLKGSCGIGQGSKNDRVIYFRKGFTKKFPVVFIIIGKKYLNGH